eukprot:CAMPEP_0181348936 /NCGR_PEP_ID=MMETSP1106-20121128/458_1 /TAXON_ID=81844 /ORGANISM="Mantoniella antarctica, Strain SL-175" /LENGTH=78 /DNA_ID=CAMNT_0023461295 /DNA_START=132 /DNA_END=368 /DNA_ORIENTATION=-
MLSAAARQPRPGRVTRTIAPHGDVRDPVHPQLPGIQRGAHRAGDRAGGVYSGHAPATSYTRSPASPLVSCHRLLHPTP